MKRSTLYLFMALCLFALVRCASEITLRGRLHLPGEGLTIKNDAVESWRRYGVSRPGAGLVWIRCPMGFDTVAKAASAEADPAMRKSLIYCSDRGTSEFWFPERRWEEKAFWIPPQPMTMKVKYRSEMEWDVASYICPAGYRLPTRQELAELLGGCDAALQAGGPGYCSPCAGSASCTDLFGEDDRSYWSESTDKCKDKTPDLFGVRKCVWAANFGTGRFEIYKNAPTNTKFVRCVRALEAPLDADPSAVGTARENR